MRTAAAAGCRGGRHSLRAIPSKWIASVTFEEEKKWEKHELETTRWMYQRKQQNGECGRGKSDSSKYDPTSRSNSPVPLTNLVMGAYRRFQCST